MQNRYTSNDVSDVNFARQENSDIANPFNFNVAQFNARLSGKPTTYTPFTTTFMAANGGNIDPSIVTNPSAQNQWGLPSGYAPTIDVDPEQPLRQLNGSWGYYKNVPINASGEGDAFPKWFEVPIQKIVDDGTNPDGTVAPVDVLTQEKTFNPNGIGLAGRITNLLDEVGGIKFSDLYDDPTTKKKNENPLPGLVKRFDNLSDAYGSLSTDFGDTDLTKTVLGSAGPLDVGELPELLEADLDLYAQSGANLGEIETLIDTLRADRTAEKDKISDFRRGVNTDLDRLLSTVGGLDYWEQNQIDQITSEYNDLKSNVKRFSSPILDQVNAGNFDNVDRRMGRLGDLLGRLENKRTKEEGRISNFSDRLLNTSDNIRNRLDDLDISDLKQLENLQDTIDDRVRDAGRFSSNLGYNFNNEIAELSSLDSDINAMLAERDAERSRITAAKEGFATEYDDIERLVGQSSIYDMGALNALDRRLDKFGRDTGNFKSDLNFNLGNYDTAGLSEDLQKLFDRRDNKLGRFTDKLSNLSQRLDGLEIQNTSKRGNVLDALQDLRYDVTAFTGGTVPDVLRDIDAQIDIVGDQNDALNTRRDEIGTDADALLKRLNRKDFFRQGQIDNQLEKYQDLVDDADKFKATGATTALDDIYELLMGNRNRLEQEAENVENYRTADRDAILRQLNGSDIARLANSGTLSAQEMEQLMALIGPADEDELAETFGSTVAANFANEFAGAS